MNNNQFHVNRFGLGADYDTDPKQIQEGKYIKGKNITLIKNGDFFSVSNIKGTDFVSEIINKANIIDSGSINVMAVCRSKYLNKTFVPEAAHECVTIFLNRRNSIGSIYEIYVYNVTTSETRRVYSKQYTSNVSKLMNSTVDFFVFGEKGYDSIYFVDGVNPLRKIPGILLSREYNDRDLATQRYYPGIDDGSGAVSSSLSTFILGDFIGSADPSNPTDPPPPVVSYNVFFSTPQFIPDSTNVYYENNIYTQIKVNPQLDGASSIMNEIVVNAEFKPRAKSCNGLIEEDLSYSGFLEVSFFKHGAPLNDQEINMNYAQTNSLNNFFTSSASVVSSHDPLSANGDDIYIILRFRSDWSDPNFLTTNCSNDGTPDFVSPGGIEGNIEILSASVIGSGNVTYGLRNIPFNITIPTV